MIDLSRWFLGDFVKVHGTTANLFWDSPVEDNAFLNLETASGKIASIHSSWTNWKPIFSFEIFGAKGYVIAEGLKNYAQEQRLTIGRRSDDFLGSNVKEETFAFDSDFNDSLAGELDEFAASILTGREPNPNGKDALNILKIVDKIYTDSSPKLLT
jgi:predicted dehydrogenase